jgi:hypothetical protein
MKSQNELMTSALSKMTSSLLMKSRNEFMTSPLPRYFKNDGFVMDSLVLENGLGLCGDGCP